METKKSKTEARLLLISLTLRTQPSPTMAISRTRNSSFLWHQQNPLTLSNSVNRTPSSLTNIFRQQAYEKDREKEKNLTKCRSGGGVGRANAGLQVITLGIFRVSSQIFASSSLCCFPLFWIRVFFLSFFASDFSLLIPSSYWFALSIYLPA
jgi:hypothetical protein